VWQTYYRPTSLAAALELLARFGTDARLIAGGTDLIVELRRGVRPAAVLVDISRVRGLRFLRVDHGHLHFGALTTHNDILASALCAETVGPLVQACAVVGAPQIRTCGTVVGNLVTASPANDTIPPLLALGAELVLASADAERVVPLEQFYLGRRQTVLQADELVREIRIPVLRPEQRGLFLKLGLRSAQAISVVNLALVLRFSGAVVCEARIALGCVTPVVVRAPTVEAFLCGRRLDATVCAEAGRLAQQDIAPLDDMRAPARYRRDALAACLREGLEALAKSRDGTLRAGPFVLLEANGPVTGRGPVTPEGAAREPMAEVIETVVNGRLCRIDSSPGTTLLSALRDSAGLRGTKEGCGEGECGACTVWLDGRAVMACLIPAVQAEGATVTTIEGLAAEGGMHRLQAAFVSCGAVQCGFCTPGFIMAAAKLLEEYRQPSLGQVQTALSGNICRCTGYRKIFDAVQAAGAAACPP
jgi:carbon-monoxide dehydrogenase medium subunit